MRFVVLENLSGDHWLVYDLHGGAGSQHVAEFRDRKAAEDTANLLNESNYQEIQRIKNTLDLMRHSGYN